MMRRLLAVGVAAVAMAGPLPAADEGVVLVVGAGGRTGQEVVAAARAAGHAVRALVRDGSQAGFPDGVTVVRGDVRDPASLAAAMRGARHVISAIGAGRGEAGNGPEQVDYRGVANLADAAAAAGVQHFVLVSSAGVTREDHILNKMFDNVLKWKARGEDALRASGVGYTIVRPGGLTNAPGGQKGVRLVQGDSDTGYIARADVARVCVAALSSAAARGRTFEVVNADVPPPQDWDALFAPLAADAPAVAAP